MNTRIVLFRLSLSEHQQLRQIAERDGETVSEVIREALYERYRIGSFSACSLTVQRPDCNTPRT